MDMESVVGVTSPLLGTERGGSLNVGELGVVSWRVGGAVAGVGVRTRGVVGRGE